LFNHDEIRKSYKEPSLKHPVKFRSIWRSSFREDFSKSTNQGKKIAYDGPSIDDSYQVLVHLAKWFERRRFLEIDQPE
jgi:hypothetical protein